VESGPPPTVASSLIETRFVPGSTTEIFESAPHGTPDVLYRWVFVEAVQEDGGLRGLSTCTCSSPPTLVVVAGAESAAVLAEDMVLHKGGGDGEAKIWVGNSRLLAIYGSRLEFHVPRPGFLVTHRLFYDIMAAEKLFRDVYGYCVCTRTDVQVTELAPVWPDPHICVCTRTDVQDTELAPVWQDTELAPMWQDPHIVLDNALHVGQNCRQHRHRSGEIIDCLVWSPDAASTDALFVVDGLVHTVVTPALTSAGPCGTASVFCTSVCYN
jgi:hypothetical protein